jgi:hypothetical protein
VAGGDELIDDVYFRSSRRQRGYVLAGSVYFELRVRFPADGQTVAIGTSDGVSECRCGCTVGQRKTNQSCVPGANCRTGVWFVGLLFVRWTSNVSVSVRLKRSCRRVLMIAVLLLRSRDDTNSLVSSAILSYTVQWLRAQLTYRIRNTRHRMSTRVNRKFFLRVVDRGTSWGGEELKWSPCG